MYFQWCWKLLLLLLFCDAYERWEAKHLLQTNTIVNAAVELDFYFMLAKATIGTVEFHYHDQGFTSRTNYVQKSTNWSNDPEDKSWESQQFQGICRLGLACSFYFVSMYTIKSDTQFENNDFIIWTDISDVVLSHFSCDLFVLDFIYCWYE